MDGCNKANELLKLIDTIPGIKESLIELEGLDLDERLVLVKAKNPEVEFSQIEEALLLNKQSQPSFASEVERLIKAFPTKSPGGRALSPAKGGGVQGQRIYLKCKRIFKGKNKLIDLQNAIRSVEVEVAYRKRTGEQEFMNAIEPWLTGGKFENEYGKDTSSQQTYGFGESV